MPPTIHFRESQALPRDLWHLARLTSWSSRRPARTPDGQDYGGPRVMWEFTIEGGPHNGVVVKVLTGELFERGSLTFRIVTALRLELEYACSITDEWARKHLFGRLLLLQGRSRVGREGLEHWATNFAPAPPAAPAAKAAEQEGRAPAAAPTAKPAVQVTGEVDPSSPRSGGVYEGEPPF